MFYNFQKKTNFLAKEKSLKHFIAKILIFVQILRNGIQLLGA
jgi:hypothetical protein